MVTVYSNTNIDKNEKVVENLNKNQLLILECMGSNPSISAEELAGIVSHRNNQANIKKRKDNNFIKRVDPDRGGCWEVIKNAE